MTHWGWYWKVKRNHKAKNVCDFQVCLDSFVLFKNKNLSGFSFNYIEGILTDDHFQVASPHGEYKIYFENQACQFGGYRYYFHCPMCNRRMRKLYGFFSLFLCRKCLNLGYFSQRLPPSVRFANGSRKVKKKLEGLGGNLYQKPKWMRWAIFERLQAKEREFDALSDLALEKEIFQFYGVLP